MKNTKKGSVTVEAAITLPIFIIAVLSIAFTIRTIGASESVMFSLCDEARLMQTYGYDIKLGNAYALKIQKRGKELAECDSFSVENFDYLFDDGYIRVDTEYSIENNMPVKLHDDFDMKEGVFFRAFIPHDNSGNIFSFEKMQMEDDDSIVWVFPVAGEKYHREDCSYIVNDPRQKVLTSEIRKKYSPCRLCRPDEYGDGHLVYVFKTGDVYHSGECSVVDRYVVPVTRSEAKKKGYAACLKCGG